MLTNIAQRTVHRIVVERLEDGSYIGRVQILDPRLDALLTDEQRRTMQMVADEAAVLAAGKEWATSKRGP